MKIYTKKGDAGETGLYGGARVPKNHLRIMAYGTLDELNACLGVCVAEISHPALPALFTERLLKVQNELFQLGAELATPLGKPMGAAQVSDAEIARLEHEIDEMEGELEPLKAFILPGGSRLSAHLHLARTVSRRAERELITLHQAEGVRAGVLQYANRLSDYLFVCARFANHLLGVADVPWRAS